MNLLSLYSLNKKYSQSGQDAFVINFFQSKRNGVFVDIGANDGITGSNTYFLEKELDWSGICFEPIPNIFDILNKNRNCIKIMAGVSDKNSIEKFTCIEGYSNMLSGMTKEYDPRHLDRINNEVKERSQKIYEIDVQCFLFNDVMKEHNIQHIDYLSIDTEGNEFKILKSIDFQNFDITIISVENNYKNPEQTNYLVSQGYFLQGSLEADEIFTKMKK